MRWPALVKQTVAIAGAHAEASPFGENTHHIRVHCDAICSISIGPPGSAEAVATTSDPRFAANQTEYFDVVPGHVLSVIANV